MPSDQQAVIIDQECDVEKTCLPFGKRWDQETLKLTAEHLHALRQGKILAVDIRAEYVLFIELDQTAKDMP